MASYLASLGFELLGPEIADDIGLLRAVGSGRRRKRRQRRRRLTRTKLRRHRLYRRRTRR